MVMPALNSIVSAPEKKSASCMAARKLPKPESLLFCTMKVAGTSRASSCSKQSLGALFWLPTPLMGWEQRDRNQFLRLVNNFKTFQRREKRNSHQLIRTISGFYPIHAVPSMARWGNSKESIIRGTFSLIKSGLRIPAITWTAKISCNASSNSTKAMVFPV